MEKLVVVFALALATQFAISSDVSPVQESARFESAVNDGKFGDRAEKALGNLIKLGSNEMKKKGALLEAAAMESEWAQEQQARFRSVVTMKSKDIGDHPDQVLSKWLDEKYKTMEFVLGIEFMKKTHLSDIHVFNATPKIVFRPCTFNMNAVTGERIDEYRRHFAYGQYYWGLAPVTTYWLTYGSCGALTAGTGYLFICGGISDISETIVGKFVAPSLSDKIYRRACS